MKYGYNPTNCWFKKGASWGRILMGNEGYKSPVIQQSDWQEKGGLQPGVQINTARRRRIKYLYQ
jgi:hypothetical protein